MYGLEFLRDRYAAALASQAQNRPCARQCSHARRCQTAGILYYLPGILLAGLLLNAFFWLWWAEPVEALIMVPIIQKKESRDCRAKPAMNATRDNYFFGSSSDIVGASLVR